MNDPIRFFSQDTHFRPKGITALRKWLKKCCREEGFKIHTLHYIFCSDEFLLELNRKFLQHDTLTDVISFEYPDQNEGTVSGEIYISVERVKENAGELRLKFRDELDRVMVHGLLHLMAYKDKSKSARRKMTSREDYFLSLR